MLEEVFATGEATWSEDLPLVMHRNLLREENFFTFSYSPIRDDSGAVGGIFCAVTEKTGRVIGEKWFGTCTDIEVQKQIQEALAKSEERYRVLFETMSEGFSMNEIIFDEAGRCCDLRYLEMNSSFERHTGLKRADVVGRTVLELFADSDPRWFETYGEVVTSGVPAHFQVNFGPLGRWFEISVYKTGPNQCATVFFDITARKRDEEKNLELVRELETQHAFVKAVLSQVPAAIVVADADTGRIRITNVEAHRIVRHEYHTGKRLEDYGNTYIREAYATDGRRYVSGQWPLDRARRGETVVAEEIELVLSDESRVIVRVNASPIQVGEKVVAAVVAFHDITDRKIAERSARFLADASAALAGLVDYEDTLQRVARLAVPGFADWAVVDMAEETGSARRLFVAHADPAKAELAQALHRRFAHAANASRPANILRTGLAEIHSTLTDEMLIAAATDEDDLRLLRELGLKSYIGVPLKVEGETVGVLSFLSAQSGRRYGEHDLAVAKDLASRASIAIENSQLYARLRDADRRKNEFLATLAHELRNPLAPLRNGLQAMKLARNNGEAIEQCRSMMERQLGQMVRLVDDLMDISRINQGKLELRNERVELAAVIHSAVETSRPLVEAMGHELTIVVPKQPVVVEADLTRLAQVFLNLLNNAAKYTERGGLICLTAERQGSDVVVSVRDNGIGIAADQLPLIFEMFTQADRALERSQGGLGIGLSLVKRLVEMHGGRIAARSDGPGKGAEFVVRLPVVTEASMPQTSVVKKDGDEKTALRILVVDDNRDGADSLSMMLKIMGNDIRTAYDGEEAVAASVEYRPDVILLDLGLPKLTGFEACRRIRALPGGKEVVIIAQTGWGQQEDRRRTHEAGFDYHMVKPVDPQALMKLLGEFQAATAESRTVP
jgi:PAS domain S-box-containing protein